MSVVIQKPTSPGVRHRVRLIGNVSNKNQPLKAKVKGFKRQAGRNNTGKITTRHQGGGHKRKLREIDFTRERVNVKGKVIAIEYDPNRSANIARIVYADGDQRYVLAPEGLKVGDPIITGESIEPKIGNTMPLKTIPLGLPIHNIELRPGKGGQIVRSAGSSALIQSREGKYATVVLPSKEIRLIDSNCFATIGQVSNIDHKNIKLGKAGRKRHLGIRPSVRGTAMHPAAHPHGGGEGRSGIGLPSPKSPWGKKTLGRKTRRKKYSTKYIIKRAK